MKQKIKYLFKQFIDYTLTDEFKTMVMIMLFCFTICGTIFGIISTALVNDTLDDATKQKEEYDKLSAKYEVLESENTRLNMYNQELYELFITCQQQEAKECENNE